MKFYSATNVFDKAIERIEYLFDEFKNVLVSFSGGKDSTVVLNLTLEVARRKNRLPVSVLFLDQEVEWQSTIDYTRRVMNLPEVNPLWLQIPIKIFNATTFNDPWLYCWKPGENWVREKEDISIKDNIYGTDRFAELFKRFISVTYPKTKTCVICGIRCEESPGRTLGLTNHKTYKSITYGKILDKNNDQYNFHPIYDWRYIDVWKAIFENRWDYCDVYNQMYRYGVPVRRMRVSNLNHETAVSSLQIVQEIEPDTWNKITARLNGINASSHLGDSGIKSVSELPYMFSSWQEYRDYLLDNLVTDQESHSVFEKEFRRTDQQFDRGAMKINDKSILCRAQIASILNNDFFMTKLKNFIVAKGRRVK